MLSRSLRHKLHVERCDLLSPSTQVYILTVIGPAGSSGGLALRGLFIGNDEECFNAAAKLSLEVNFTLVPRPIQKVGALRAQPTYSRRTFRTDHSSRHGLFLGFS